jgi:hypothetical protein
MNIKEVCFTLYRPDTGFHHIETVEQHLKHSADAIAREIPPEWHVVGIFPDRLAATQSLGQIEERKTRGLFGRSLVPTK